MSKGVSHAYRRLPFLTDGLGSLFLPALFLLAVAACLFFPAASVCASPGGAGNGARVSSDDSAASGKGASVVREAVDAASLRDPENAPLPAVEWSAIKPGLELGLACLPLTAAFNREDRLVIIRIDPRKYNFSLHMASDVGNAHSLRGWAEVYGLEAGINASMYLPDKLTSTGLLRGPGHVNNARAGSRLGAFFVASPQKKGLPAADVLERESKGVSGLLERYAYVAQNYRLINGSGEILWPKNGTAHSSAAVGRDGKGRILFLLCQEPLPPHTFARFLQRLSLGVAPVMYVEGGGPAGLFLFEKEGGRENRPGAVSYAVPGGVVHVWKGRQSMLHTKGPAEAPLPNIIGVRSR